MSTVATLVTEMRLNSASFRQGMISAAAQANSSLTAIQKQAKDTATVLGSLKRAAETFGSFYLLKEGIGSLLEAQKQLQSIQYTLVSATGTTTAASAAFEFLRNESQSLGLSLPVAAGGFAKLSAAASASGVSMDAQRALFDAFAKSSTTLHLSADASGRALLALQEMFSRGTIQSRQLNQQLGQAIPGSAARFKNAVREMIKGTDLQGKSFEQLIKGGKLVTSQFLPALTQALLGTAGGWEEASKGLNANLNRVATAWFNLKTTVSGGLFNDVATGGAGLLADQLSHIATTLTLIGTGALGRVVGTQIKQGVDAARTFGQKNYSGPNMAATASREEADAALLAAKAERDLASSTARSAAVAEKSVRQVRDLNRERQISAEVSRKMATESAATAAAEVQRTAALASVVKTRNAFTTAENVAAAESAQVQAAATAKQVEDAIRLTGALSTQATAQRTIVSLTAENTAAQKALAAADLEVARSRAFADAPDPRVVELTARQAAAQEALVASQAQLAAAQKVEAQATAAANGLKEQAVIANRQLELSNAALAASENAVAVAEARAAAMKELEVATGSLAALAGRAAASFGSFALSLVGGVWGAAVIAVGALGYAVYHAVKSSEDYRVETADQIKALQALRTEVQGAADGYLTLHASMNTSQTMDTYLTADTALRKTGYEIDDLKAKAEELRKSIDSHSAHPDAGTAIIDWFDQRKLNLINTRIAELGNTYQLAQIDVDGLKSKLNLFTPAVDAVSAAMKGLLENASFGDIWSRVKDAFAGAPAMADALQARVESEGNSITALGESFDQQSKHIGHTAHAQIQAMIDQRIADARKLGMAQKEINKINEEGATAMVGADAKDSADRNKKIAEAGVSAAKKTAEAYASTVRAIRDRIAADQEQSNSDSLITAAERERAKVLINMSDGTLKVTATQRAYIVSLLDQDVALQKANKVEAEHQKSLALTAALEDQLATRLQNRRDQNAIAAAGVGQGAQETQKMQDELRIRQDYQRQVDQLNREANKPANVGTPDAIGGDNYNSRLGKIAKGQAAEIALYEQGARDKLRAEKDWTNGATAALRDYQDKAANVAQASQDVWSMALQGMEDSLVNFVTTGKASFRSLVTDILKEIARIEIRLAVSKLAGIIGSMFGSFGAEGTNTFNAMGGVSQVGGRALGGGVSANRMYEVAEKGKPELLTTAGRTYLMMGNTAGSVTPTSGGTSASGSGSAPAVNVNVQVMVNSDGSSSTKVSSDDQRAQSKQLGDSMAAAAKQVILKEMQPNGVLWKQYA